MASQNARLATVLDLIELTKPRITCFVLFSTSVGIWLTSIPVTTAMILMTLVGMGLAVGGVNALNMYLEIDVDGLMERTRERPLPAERLNPTLALCFGIALATTGVLLMSFGIHVLAGILTLLAVVSYVLLYTPLKQFTPSALYVGAVPGALPPLIGWTAATGAIELPGLILFGIIFFWQIPHFLAIALFRKEDYAQAGLPVLPVVKGTAATKWQILVGLILLIPTSLMLVPLGIGGTLYLIVASILGLVFLGTALKGFRSAPVEKWARQLFFVSLIYLVGVFAVLLVPVS